MPGPIKILFVCIGNCVRSQMAEAIARHSASDVLAAESAGIHPLGFIDPTARAVLEKRGISIDGQFSKGLHNHVLGKPDLVINMSGLSISSHFAGTPLEEWKVEDPFGESMETHTRICDDIEARIAILVARLRAANDATP
jgi:arsenate reductase (thioredoxin)